MQSLLLEKQLPPLAPARQRLEIRLTGHKVNRHVTKCIYKKIICSRKKSEVEISVKKENKVKVDSHQALIHGFNM